MTLTITFDLDCTRVVAFLKECGVPEPERLVHEHTRTAVQRVVAAANLSGEMHADPLTGLPDVSVAGGLGASENGVDNQER
jgi:hypothetical protein